MCKNEQFLQMLWTDDHIEMSLRDLLHAIKVNGFRLISMTSKN